MHVFYIHYTLSLINATDQDEWLQLLAWQGKIFSLVDKHIHLKFVYYYSAFGIKLIIGNDD